MSVFWIASRELKAAFSTTVGWLVLCAFLLITGVFWVISVDSYVAQTSDIVYDPYAAQHHNLSDVLLLPFFGNCTVILLMMAPALSMRAFSEEFRQHTIELLLTSPITTAEIVLGKYLGALGVLGVMLACTLHYPLMLGLWGTPDWGMLAGGYLALGLLGAAILAIGLWFSSSTSNQVVASVLTFGAALALYVLGWSAMDPDDLQVKLSLSTHLADPLRGEVRLSGLAYFAGLIGVSLFATHQRLESFRWK